MLARDNAEDTATEMLYGDCPGYHFCKELLRVNQAINSLAREEKSISKIQSTFNNIYSKLEPLMRNEEDNRTELQVSASLTRYLNNHEEEKRQLKKELSDVETSYQKTLDDLKRKKTDITADIEIEITKSTAQKAQDMKEYIEAFNPLNAKADRLQEQYRLKQQEIDTINNKCCACFYSNPAAKEEKQLSDIMAQQKLNENEMAALKQRQKQNPHELNIKNLEKKRDETIAQLETLIKDYPAQKENAEKKLSTAVVKYKEAKASFDKKVQQHYSIVSVTSMMLYIRSYVCFLKLKQTTEEAWGIRFNQKRGELPANDNLSVLKEKLNEIKTKLDEWMNILRLNNHSQKNAMDFFQNLDKELTPSEKENFIHGKISSEVDKKIIPPQDMSANHPAKLFSPTNNPKKTEPSIPTIPLTPKRG